MKSLPNNLYFRTARWLRCLAIGASLMGPSPCLAQGASPAVSSDALPKAGGSQEASELTAHDEPATFKVNVKLVVLRAVVRDAKGNAVGGLRQEDFQVADRGKPQTITQFEVEQPGSLAEKSRRQAADDSEESLGEMGSSPSTASALPERFVAYLFDDVHLEFGDLARVREAADRHFSTLRPTDRAAIFTTSGVSVLDFTDDRTRLRDTLLSLQPRPIAGRSSDCPNISYYQADLIVNHHDPEAASVATEEAMGCLPVNSRGQPIGNPAALVDAVSMGAISAGQQESRVSLLTLKSVVERVSKMPGQRSVVLVSPGFITPQLEYEYNGIIDRAVRSQVVINALDARGLYVVIPFGDASNGFNPVGTVHAPPPGKILIETAAASANDDLLSTLAESTGGVFFRNNNDFEEGFRRVAQAPEFSYLLAFTPQNLKLDGSFHALKVTLKSPQKLNVQARRGYYAPKGFADPEEQARQEIEDAMYSQEEVHNLPVKLHTQFFKVDEHDAKLVVLAHVDLKQLHFKKGEGRNNDVLTCVSALFNRNGSFVQGTQKIVTMHLKDETLKDRLASGLTLKTSFDVKPGSYLVRLVVRDAESRSLSAENGSVEIR
jgi:VWFA-related protein